jgi:hypothetical protein
MIERYSFPDFIAFCGDRDSSFLSDGEIYWCKRIPIPSILAKRLFFSVDIFLKEYIYHLLSAIALALHDLKNPNSKIFHLFPNCDERIAHNAELRTIWAECQSISSFKDFEKSVSQLCGFGSFELKLEYFLNSLDHKGKKYDRLYYPDVVKKLIDVNFPKVVDFLDRSKGDMFGNIVVDRLNIYRSGFSDAFSGLFNEYLTFKFEYFPDANPQNASTGQIEIISIPNIGSIAPVEYANGYFWEPTMEQGGAIGVELATSHPISLLAPQLQLNLLLLALSKEEMKIFDPDLKAKIEDFRFRVSVSLKDFVHAIETMSAD